MTAETRRILIIDDSELVREAATLALELGGYEVETAADGESGLAAALAAPPDGVLLDVVMPGLDGVQTLRRLQETPRTSSVPVAFLTAQGDDPVQRDALLAEGADAVITKPFQMPELAGVVRAAFGWPA